jgi:DNA polymerase III delta prime subunit
MATSIQLISNLECLDTTQPILFVGPAGVGKSYVIEALAKKKKLTLYSYNCRRDKTLREGRNKLINWVFLKEPCIVWLEGADDLTIEAQSFLRRSLETYSRTVILVLEVRDASYLADPLRSRCKSYIIERPTIEEACAQFPALLIEEINRIQPLSYRALNVYKASKNLVIPEKGIFEESDDYNVAMKLIKNRKATMKNALCWRKNGLYINKLVDDSMSQLNLKWWSDMPAKSRGKNGWFLLAYILSKTQNAENERVHI